LLRAAKPASRAAGFFNIYLGCPRFTGDHGTADAFASVQERGLQEEAASNCAQLLPRFLQGLDLQSKFHSLPPQLCIFQFQPRNASHRAGFRCDATVAVRKEHDDRPAGIRGWSTGRGGAAMAVDPLRTSARCQTNDVTH
jgi:hypothetical protein